MGLLSKLIGPNLRKGVALPLLSRRRVNHDSSIFRFDRPEGLEKLPVGQHVLVHGPGMSDRPYTPISAPDAPFIDLLIKVYYPDKEKNIPGGRMTMWLDKLKEGEQATFTGPAGEISVEDNDIVVTNPWQNNSVERITPKRVLMLAAGSGITPMYQLLTQAPQIASTLLFFNRTDEDILLRNEFEELQSDSFSFHPVVEEGTTVLRGRLTKELVEPHATPFGGDCDVALVCGPAPFEHAAWTLLGKQMKVVTF